MSETVSHKFASLPPAVAGLGYIFARPKILAALCVIVIASLGWLYLALLIAGMGGSAGVVGSGTLQALCRPLPDGSASASSVAIVASMWAAMTLAMMLPSAGPMIFTYAGIADTAARKGERIVSPFVLAAGYGAVWLAFAGMATFAQFVFARAAFVGVEMAPTSGLFSGAIFLGAGLYQFSALKNACLIQCQQPFPFFLANWVTTQGGVFRLGLRQGLFCLGCCWALMSVMFAAGVMNVIWMEGLGIVMTIEKMVTGRRFSDAVGVVLIVAGVAVALIY